MPVVIDLAKEHCPESSDTAKAQANLWVKRLRTEDNQIGKAKDKLNEYQLGQVRDKAVINELLKDNATCRDGGQQKVASQ